MTTYYQTTPITGKQKELFTRKAKSQEEKIGGIFKQWGSGYSFSPSVMMARYFPDTPITSVRRAFTNLTIAGVIHKTDQLTDGLHGRPEHTWTLNEESSED